MKESNHQSKNLLFLECLTFDRSKSQKDVDFDVKKFMDIMSNTLGFENNEKSDEDDFSGKE